MKSLINMFRKEAVTTLKAKHPKNQALLDVALVKLNNYSSSISDRMIWESNVKQILLADKPL